MDADPAGSGIKPERALRRGEGGRAAHQMVMHESSQDPAGPASAGGARSHQPRRARRGRRAYLLVVVAVLLAVVAVVAARHHHPEVTVTHGVIGSAGGRVGDLAVYSFNATFASDSPVNVYLAVFNNGAHPARYTLLLRLQSADGGLLVGTREVTVPRVDAGQSYTTPVSFPALSTVVDGPVDVVLAADVTREAA